MGRLDAPINRAALAMLATMWIAAYGRAEGITTVLSGYGTVGGTFTSDGRYAYHHDPSEFTGASSQLDVGLESRLGVQAVVDFGSGFSVTAQEVARQRGDNEFSLGTEWLYAQFSPNPDFKIRLGRVVVATFLFSDSREVGYAAPWFRAPNELYGFDPIQYLDGAQALWHHSAGQLGFGLGASYGKAQAPFLFRGAEMTLHVKEMYNVAASLDYGNFLFRIAQTTHHVPTSLPLSATNLVNFNVQDKFTTVGLQYDNGKAIVLSEWAERSDNRAPVLLLPAAGSHEWYLAGGWRFGRLTPLLSYAASTKELSLSSPQGNFGTWSASLRYDIVRNVALKAQVSRAQAGNDDYWITPDHSSRERVNVYSLGVDFVF